MFGISLLVVYRLLALIVTLMMVLMMFREKGWQNQFVALIVFVPFALRAAGVK